LSLFHKLRYNTIINIPKTKVSHLHKIIIFGNSGSGKSTLAKKISTENKLAHLDLDTLAWLATTPPQRKSISDSANEIALFTKNNEDWVIEGCYSDLLELLTIGSNSATSDNLITSKANEIVFLDLPIETCIANAQKRPWEPHKYASKQAQDDNLEMLINWIKAYETRTDSFSKQAHHQLYDAFKGKKTIIKTNN